MKSLNGAQKLDKNFVVNDTIIIYYYYEHAKTPCSCIHFQHQHEIGFCRNDSVCIEPTARGGNFCIPTSTHLLQCEE